MGVCQRGVLSIIGERVIMFKHILIPTDGSELSRQAATAAIELAKRLKAKTTLILVSPTFKQMADEGFFFPGLHIQKREWEQGAKERAQKVLEESAAVARNASVGCGTVHTFADLPHKAIIDTAKKNGCDLIVMGSHGYSGFKQVMLGSETAKVLSQSKIPVLVYR